MYRSWAAEARAAAEAQQLAKTPSQWLERNSSSKLMDEPEEKNTQLITNNQGQQQAAFGAYQLLAAMKVLHNASRYGDCHIAVLIVQLLQNVDLSKHAT